MGRPTEFALRWFSGVEVPDDDSKDTCWNWTRSLTPEGYGRCYARFPHATEKLAHRVAWVMNNGPIEAGQQINHHCDNRRCVRIGHLYVGTQRNNMEDRKERRRHQYGAGHHKAKMTDETVREARRLFAAGERNIDVARRFGVRPATMSKILKGDAWTHVK